MTHALPEIKEQDLFSLQEVVEKVTHQCCSTAEEFMFESEKGYSQSEL